MSAPWTPGPWQDSDELVLRFGDSVLGHQIWGKFGNPRIALMEQHNVGPAEEAANAALIALSPEWPEVMTRLAEAFDRVAGDAELSQSTRRARRDARALLAWLPKGESI